MARKVISLKNKKRALKAILIPDLPKAKRGKNIITIKYIAIDG